MAVRLVGERFTKEIDNGREKLNEEIEVICRGHESRVVRVRRVHAIQRELRILEDARDQARLDAHLLARRMAENGEEGALKRAMEIVDFDTEDELNFIEHKCLMMREEAEEKRKRNRRRNIRETRVRREMHQLSAVFTDSDSDC